MPVFFVRPDDSSDIAFIKRGLRVKQMAIAHPLLVSLDYISLNRQRDLRIGNHG